MNKRPFLLIAGAALALFIGLVAFISGLRGLGQPLNTADGLTAWPNLLIGLASIVAALGFWQTKKWSVLVYLFVFAGHVFTQVLLYFARSAAGRTVPPITLVFLAVIPLLSLTILTDMEYHRWKGILS